MFGVWSLGFGIFVFWSLDLRIGFLSFDFGFWILDFGV